MNRSVWMTGLVGAILATGCAYQHRLLVNPEVSVPPHVSSTDVEKAVRKALTDYGWTVDKEEAGSTTAHLRQDALFASVRVVYDEKLATIRYLESKNFRYEKTPTGEERIHGHYLLWVRNIAERLREKLDSLSH